MKDPPLTLASRTNGRQSQCSKGRRRHNRRTSRNFITTGRISLRPITTELGVCVLWLGDASPRPLRHLRGSFYALLTSRATVCIEF